MGSKKWTDEDNIYLQDFWGLKSVDTIARHLGRSRNAIKIRAQRLGLGSCFDSANGVQLFQVAPLLGVDYRTVYNWTERRGLPYFKKNFYNGPSALHVRYVRLEDFWRWAEKNKHRVNFARIEPGALGPEPGWLIEARRISAKGRAKQVGNTRKWSGREDAVAEKMTEAGATLREIAEELQRTEGAVQRRLYELGLPAAKKAKARDWKPEEVARMLELLRIGWGFYEIGTQLGRSERSVRGKCERMGILGKTLDEFLRAVS